MMETVRRIFPNAVLLTEVDKLLREGRTVVIMTKGVSMSPFIRGERDSVELIREKDVSVGDIVLAQLKLGHFVLHRVHAREDDSLILKGDGNLVGTERCTVADVCGTVVRILKEGGRVIDCSDPAFVRRSRRWVNAPYQVRRIYLGFYRRLKFMQR